MGGMRSVYSAHIRYCCFTSYVRYLSDWLDSSFLFVHEDSESTILLYIRYRSCSDDPCSTIWIYLFSLPFQLIDQFGWCTIPGVCIASFIFLGFIAAGEEIEQPFGYDEVSPPLSIYPASTLSNWSARVERSRPGPLLPRYRPQGYWLPEGYTVFECLSHTSG